MVTAFAHGAGRFSMCPLVVRERDVAQWYNFCSWRGQVFHVPVGS